MKRAPVIALAARGPQQSRIPAEASTDQQLAKLDLRLLALLGRHTQRDGWCCRSQVRMAAELHTARRCVVRSIGKLARLGYLIRAEQEGARGGAQRPLRYRLATPGGMGLRESQGDGTQGVPGDGTQGVPSYVKELTAPSLTAAAADGTRSEKGHERQSSDLTERAVALHRRVCARVGLPDGYRDDLGEVLAWLEAGYDAERDVLPAIDRVAKRRRFQPPFSLSYFRDAITDEAARRGPRAAQAAQSAVAARAEIEPDGPPEWLRLRERLRRDVGADVFAAWFAPLEWRGVAGDTLSLGAPTRFARRYLLQHYEQVLRLAAKTELGAGAVEVRHG